MKLLLICSEKYVRRAIPRKVKKIKIKRILLFFILWTGVNSTSSAFSTNFGGYVGYNHAQLSSANVYLVELLNIFGSLPTQSFQASYSLGGYGNVKFDLPFTFGLPFTPNVAAQAELTYSTGGGKFDVALGSSSSTIISLTYSYLDIPLIFKLGVPIDLIEIYLINGISLSFLQTAGSTLAETTSSSSGKVESIRENSFLNERENIKLNLFNVNYLIGIGASYSFSSSLRAFFDIRHGEGLRNIHKDGGLREIRHINLYLLLGAEMQI